MINIDLTSVNVKTACFNGIFDGNDPPYEDIDLYVRFQNDIFAFVYGSERQNLLREINNNEYVIFILGDSLSGEIERKENNHIYLT